MENASKALIIAGAILLAIAIIGVGMAVFNNAQDSVAGADTTSEEVTAFNSKFDSYEGLVRGSRAKTLINAVKQHNLTTTDDSEKVQVLTDGADNIEVDVQDVSEDNVTTQAVQTVADGIQSGATYEVSFGYDSSSGRITTVYVVEQE